MQAQVVLGTLLAVVSVVTGSQVTAWPAAPLSLPLLRTLPALPASRGFAYSTTQYIGNPAPLTYYQFPQPVRAFSPLHAPYYPFAAPSYFSTGPSYFPAAAGAVYYPSAVAPILPQDSIASLPGASYPTQPTTESPAGDSDTAVIDSAEFPGQSSESSFASDAPTPAPPTSQPAPSFPGFPGFPSLPQFPQLPSFPSFPFPQAPSTPAPSETQSENQFPGFPSSDREDKGLNDEDTVSVDSA